MTDRTFGKTRDCYGCRFWSEMVAQSIGCGPIEALCLSGDGPLAGKYMRGRATCSSWKSGHFGAVDDPPDYGEATRAAYEEEEAALMSWDAWGDDSDPVMEQAINSLMDSGWWPSEHVERVKEAIITLTKTQFYEVRGQPASGVAVEFIMRLNLLQYEAGLIEASHPLVAEALAYFAEQEARASAVAKDITPEPAP